VNGPVDVRDTTDVSSGSIVRELSWKCVLCKHLLETSFYMTAGSNKRRSAVKLVFCIHIPSGVPGAPDCFLWGYFRSKVYEIHLVRSVI
jgi:hypothetical protein